MQTPQLFCIVGVLMAVTACSRAETEARKDQAAADVRAAAVKARERLADGWLVTKIQAQYFADNDVKARYINVSARDGVVTLTGRVDTAVEHEQAVQIAKNTDGVTRVDDRLTATSGTASTPPPSPAGAVATGGSAPVAPDASAAPIDDAQITARVQSKFFLDEQVKSRRIEVDVRQGVVTLQGEVASEAERAQALLLARTTEGVRRVEDHLTVDAGIGSGVAGASGASGAQGALGTSGATPPLDDEAMATMIQAKFFLDSGVKQGNVEVSSKDGIVLLQGTVPTEAAHQQALTIARTTEGVIQVVDRLQVQKAPQPAPRRRTPR